MKYRWIFLVLFTMLNAADCTQRAYSLGVGESKSSLALERASDKIYLTGSCGCYAVVNTIVKSTTLGITENRVNPATDLLIESLKNQLVDSDTKIRELVNLKYVNSMYSFYDKQDGKGSVLSSSVDGCGENFVFPATLNAKPQYRQGILLEIVSVLKALKQSVDGLATINQTHM